MKKTIRSDVLYALCHILDDYPKFATALDQIQKNNRNNNWIHRILLMQKKGTVTLRATPMERNFYKENQEVIESIYNDGALTNFLWSEKTERDYFYQYLMKNRENLKQIIAVITKLRELKFYKINLDENADFTKSVFALSYDASHLAPLIHFCDNMYALPNFDISNIKYKTKKSDYLISIQYFGTEPGENPWEKEIILNNLVFDVNRLPQNLNR